MGDQLQTTRVDLPKEGVLCKFGCAAMELCCYIFRFIWGTSFRDSLLRRKCNVPILGHYNFTECYAYQSSQIGVTESSGDIEGFYWARLASFIIRIHSAQLGFGFVAFRRFP
jgi:hypothetical protein